MFRKSGERVIHAFSQAARPAADPSCNTTIATPPCETTSVALELLKRMMAWEMRDRLSWDVEDLVHYPDTYPQGCVEWTVRSGAGGPVRISHDMSPLALCSAEELAQAAHELVDTAVEAERYQDERVAYEARMARAARSLLRRKAAAGIRLAGVLSSTIPTNWHHDTEVDVTFEWTSLGRTVSDTLEVGSEKELRDAFDGLLDRICSVKFRDAA